MSNKLTEPKIKKIIQETIKDTLSIVKIEEGKIIKERKSTALFNAKLLLEKYRELKAHCDIIPQQIEQIANHDLDKKKMNLETLITEKAKTYSMMLYVDAAIDAYEKLCMNSDDPTKKRRFDVLNRLYLSKHKLNVEQLMDLKNISQRQVYKDRDAAISDIAVILFGGIMLTEQECKKSAKKVQR